MCPILDSLTIVLHDEDIALSVEVTYLVPEPHCMMDYTRHSDIDTSQD